MTANLSHFAINSTDVEASRRFYEEVFGWTFMPFGPPGFFRIQTGGDNDPGVGGALQEARQLVAGKTTRGLECTFAVDDVDATLERAVGAGGTVLMERFTISGVGHLGSFMDPCGQPILAMEYDSTAS